MTTMSQLSIDKELGPRPSSTNQGDNHVEITLPDEEDINLDQEPDEEEVQIKETTAIGMERSAIFAKSKVTDKKNARNDSRRTSRAAMLKDDTTGQKSTSWTKTPKPRQSAL
jgi:hypothetical protein